MMMTEAMVGPRPHPIDYGSARWWYLAGAAVSTVAVAAPMALLLSMVSVGGYVAAVVVLAVGAAASTALTRRAWQETPGAFGRKSAARPAHRARFIPVVMKWAALVAVVVWVGQIERGSVLGQELQDAGLLMVAAYWLAATVVAARERAARLVNLGGGTLACLVAAVAVDGRSATQIAAWLVFGAVLGVGAGWLVRSWRA